MTRRKHTVELRLTENEIRVLEDALTKYAEWGGGDFGLTREDYRDIKRAERVRAGVRKETP